MQSAIILLSNRDFVSHKPSVYAGLQTLRFIPTRSWNSYLKQLGLDDICSDSSDCFDYPYYHSYTMDAYQNLISGDKRYNERKVIVAGGCCPSISTL